MQQGRFHGFVVSWFLGFMVSWFHGFFGDGNGNEKFHSQLSGTGTGKFHSQVLGMGMEIPFPHFGNGNETLLFPGMNGNGNIIAKLSEHLL